MEQELWARVGGAARGCGPLRAAALLSHTAAGSRLARRRVVCRVGGGCLLQDQAKTTKINRQLRVRARFIVSGGAQGISFYRSQGIRVKRFHQKRFPAEVFPGSQRVLKNRFGLRRFACLCPAMPLGFEAGVRCSRLESRASVLGGGDGVRRRGRGKDRSEGHAECSLRPVATSPAAS